MNNKQIKFRVWDREKKKMYNAESIHCSPTLSTWIKENFDRLLVDGENADFMQFTGLMDKNGNEIYEGDLLKVKMGFDLQADLYYVKDSRMLYGDRTDSVIYYRITECEIVGNEFENPKLLT